MTALDKYAGDIIDHLERLEHASGTRAGTVFDDFLTASLLLHRHAFSHLPVVGTAGRLGYLWGWWTLIRFALAQTTGVRATLPRCRPACSR